MKKIFLIPLILALIIFSTLAIAAFVAKGGSATITCSSPFATCTATCTETRIYSSAECEGGSTFPDCKCDGFMKKENKSIGADSTQLKNLNEFIEHAIELNTTPNADLIENLREIKQAVADRDYPAYEKSTEKYREITAELSDSKIELLNGWIKKKTQ